MANERPQRMCDIDFDEVELSSGGGAYLAMIDGDVVSLPISQCTLHEDGKTVSVPHWLALKEGLI